MNFPTDLQALWRGKRFHSINRVLHDSFAARVYKIGLRLDFTCPNRNGKVAVGGCLFCNNASHTPVNRRGALVELLSDRVRGAGVDFLERLSPDIVMHRLSAAAHRAITVAPPWSVDKRGVHNAIQHALIQRDAWQGRLYTKREFRNSLPNMSSEGAEL